MSPHRTAIFASRIVNPKEIALKKDQGHDEKKLEEELHDNTFGKQVETVPKDFWSILTLTVF